MAAITGQPLVQLCPMRDEFAEGIHHIEIIGDNARVVYFKRILADDGVTPQLVALEFAIVFPLRNLPPGIEQRFRVVALSPTTLIVRDAAMH